MRTQRASLKNWLPVFWPPNNWGKEGFLSTLAIGSPPPLSLQATFKSHSFKKTSSLGVVLSPINLQFLYLLMLI